MLIFSVAYLLSAYFTPSPFGTSPGYVSVLNIVLEYTALIYFIAKNRKIEKVPPLFWPLLVFYCLNFLVYTIASDLTTHSSFHASIKGLLYLTFALCAFNSQVCTRKLLFQIVLILSASQYLRIIGGISINHLVNFGAMGSYIGLACISALYMCQIKSRAIKVYLIISVYFANSVSSVASFVIGYTTTSILNFSVRRIALVVITILSLLYFVFAMLGLDVDDIKIANKSFETLLTGSGRFLIYSHCVNWLATDFPIFGLGLFNEGPVFAHGHPLEHGGPSTCHSSILSTTVSYGILGIILLIIIYAIMFAHMLKFRHYLGTTIITSFMIFALFASFFPGSGSFIITVIFLSMKANYEDYRSRK